jgi:putative DNA primase/helicase
VNVDRWPDSVARDAAFDVFARLDRLDPGELGADIEGGIPGLRFDPEAQEIADDWRTNLEARLRDPNTDEPDAFISHLAKFRSLAPSLALLYHLADGGPGPGPVSAEAAAAALAWCDYLEAHARRVYAAARHPELKAAHDLERRLRRGDLAQPFTAREVYGNHWSALDRESVERALEYLESLGRVRSEEQKSGGRPLVLWHVHPAVMEGRA